MDWKSVSSSHSYAEIEAPQSDGIRGWTLLDHEGGAHISGISALVEEARVCLLLLPCEDIARRQLYIQKWVLSRY